MMISRNRLYWPLTFLGMIRIFTHDNLSLYNCIHFISSYRTIHRQTLCRLIVQSLNEITSFSVGPIQQPQRYFLRTALSSSVRAEFGPVIVQDQLDCVCNFTSQGISRYSEDALAKKEEDEVVFVESPATPFTTESHLWDRSEREGSAVEVHVNNECKTVLRISLSFRVILRMSELSLWYWDYDE